MLMSWLALWFAEAHLTAGPDEQRAGGPGCFWTTLHGGHRVIRSPREGISRHLNRSSHRRRRWVISWQLF